MKSDVSGIKQLGQLEDLYILTDILNSLPHSRKNQISLEGAILLTPILNSIFMKIPSEQ